MHAREQRLRGLIEPAVTVLGFELLGVKVLKEGHGSRLCVYIDGEDGITVDDCARVSHQVSGVLDVADPIRGQYTLEVSSPGLDRPLFTAQHYERYRGRQVKLKMLTPFEGRRKFKGELMGLRDAGVCLEERGVEWVIPLELISSGRLVPED